MIAIFHYGTEFKKMTALLSYLEFQFEACLQIFLQTYIGWGYYKDIRMKSISQLLSYYQSQLTIILTLTNVWLPQLVGNRQNVSTLKTKVWQFSLNITLFLSLLETLTISFKSRKYYVIFSVVMLYACMASTVLLYKNSSKKLKQIERLKSCLISSLFLVQLVFSSFILYTYTYSKSVIISLVMLYSCMVSTMLLHINCSKKLNQTERLKSCLLCFLFLVKLAYHSFLLYLQIKAGYFSNHIPIFYFNEHLFINFSFYRFFFSIYIWQSSLRYAFNQFHLEF